MEEPNRITFEIDRESLAELESLASAEHRTVADIAAEATLEHLAATRAYHAAIDEGQADFAAGRALSHEEFLARRAANREAWLAGRRA
jgi:predicted transcriptional regulator